MKATEISPRGARPHNRLPQRSALAEKVASAKPVKKHIDSVRKSVPAAPAVFGVDDPDGHVIKRIRQHKPNLWNKIQNWD